MLSVAGLFVGCGGLDLGFRDAGFDLVWANDIDSDSCETYKKHVDKNVFAGDIRDYINSIPNVDILLGGPPCQPFSLVGKRLENDPRSSLVISYVEAVKKVRPRVFLMENVPGLASSKINNKRLPNVLSEMFFEIGYRTYLFKVRAVDYFVPQKRERLILVGFQKGSLKQEFKLIDPKDYYKIVFGKTPKNNFISAREAIDDLGPSHGDIVKHKKCFYGKYGGIASNPYSKLMRKNSNNTVSLHLTPTMSKKDKEFVEYIPPGGNHLNIPDHVATPRILKFRKTGGRTTTYGRLHPDNPSYTINTYFNRPNVGSNYHYKEKRLITPREALRLQSFADDFIPFFSSQRSLFMQIGNAVPPLMARALAESIKRALNE